MANSKKSKQRFLVMAFIIFYYLPEEHVNISGDIQC